MSIEELIKKKEECMISVFRGKGAFFFSFLATTFPFSLSFYLIGNSNPLFLQNSPFLSRQFTFKYFNNYFPKKKRNSLA
jgi:hypothetical protein